MFIISRVKRIRHKLTCAKYGHCEVRYLSNGIWFQDWRKPIYDDLDIIVTITNAEIGFRAEIDTPTGTIATNVRTFRDLRRLERLLTISL